MNSLQQLLSLTDIKPDQVMHLGAGSGLELDLYRSLGVQKSILVEPVPDLAASIEKKLRGSTDAVVYKIVAATQDGRQTLNVTNNPRFSSLLLLNRILEYFPNIRVDKLLEVDALTINSLCRLEKINRLNNNLLVTEVMGAEHELLQQTGADTLQNFKWIIVRSSRDELFAPSRDTGITGLLRYLEESGFTVLEFSDESPPFCNILAIRNSAVLENQQLLKQHGEHRKTVHFLEHNSARQLEKLKASLALNENLQQKLDKVGREHSKASVHLQKENRLIAAEAMDQKRQADVLRQHLSELVASLEKQNVLLIKEKADRLHKIESKFQDMRDRQASYKEKITSMRSTAENRSEELERLQDTLRLNNKLMLKADADFKDLQNQYRVAMQRQERQNTLLYDLKEKLHQASVFYRELSVQDHMLASDYESKSSEPVDSGKKD